MFNEIQRLAHAYIKICAAGSVLFSRWRSYFYCDRHKEYSVSVDFDLAGEKLHGHEDVQQEINEVSAFMEKCCGEWSDYIREARKRHKFLNYYTIQQLVFLRKELAKLCDFSGKRSHEDVSNDIFGLLNLLKPSCTLEDVKTAIEKAFNSLQEAEQKAKEEREEQETDPEKRAAIEFIRAMVKSGYKESLALRALEEVSPYDKEEGLCKFLLKLINMVVICMT